MIKKLTSLKSIKDFHNFHRRRNGIETITNKLMNLHETIPYQNIDVKPVLSILSDYKEDLQNMKNNLAIQKIVAKINTTCLDPVYLDIPFEDTNIFVCKTSMNINHEVGIPITIANNFSDDNINTELKTSLVIDCRDIDTFMSSNAVSIRFDESCQYKYINPRHDSDSDVNWKPLANNTFHKFTYSVGAILIRGVFYIVPKVYMYGDLL